MEQPNEEMGISPDWIAEDSRHAHFMQQALAMVSCTQR